MTTPIGRTPRRVVVTGGSRGIGLGLVRHLVRRGHRVVATERRPGSSAALAATGVPVAALDLDSDDDVDALASAVATHLDRVDVLVNNAGVKRAPGRPWSASAGPMPTLERSAVASVIGTDAIAPVLVAQTLLPLMGPGSVVANISSQLGSLHSGVGVDYAYNAAKAALNMLTVTMARDLGTRGIVPVAVNPGWIRTDMTAGDDAPLDVDEATADIAELLVRLGPEHAGRFVDRFGESVPW